MNQSFFPEMEDMMSPGKPRDTVHGHDFFEVSSAFQKAVRRCLVDEAVYWGVELYLSGFDQYAWKRMLIMVSEDVGPANPQLPATMAALHQTFQMLKKKNDKNEPERLPFVHAVFILAESAKTRIIDNLLICAFATHMAEDRPIPGHALDKHTQAGRAAGRGWEHFFTEGTKLGQEPHEYAGRSRGFAAKARELLEAGVRLPPRRGNQE